MCRRFSPCPCHLPFSHRRIRDDPSLGVAPEWQWQLNYTDSQLLLQVVPGNVFRSTSVTNGNFQFTFTGQTGSLCLIEVSTNLFDWSPRFTNAPFKGTLDFTELQTAGFPG